MNNQSTSNQTQSSAAHKFLLAEYESLINIDISRNERIDRVVTIFVSLAGVPFAVAAFLWSGTAKVTPASVPLPLGWLFLLVGFLGSLLALLVAQIRLNIILYVKAANAIRGFFADTDPVKQALLLPKKPNVPYYYEPGKHTHITILAMGVVNSVYVGLGLYLLPPLSEYPLVCGITGVFWLALHWFFYWYLASRRDARHPTASSPQF